MPKDNAAMISASRTDGASGSAPIGADATPGRATEEAPGSVLSPARRCRVGHARTTALAAR
jgi:hypothetical protein